MKKVNTGRVSLLTAELRKPERKQARGWLGVVAVAPDGTEIKANCCLGVAYEVAAENGFQVNIVRKALIEAGYGEDTRGRDEFQRVTGIDAPAGSKFYKISYNDNTAFLDEEASDWYGLPYSPKLPLDAERAATPIEMNDGTEAVARQNFGAIADAFDAYAAQYGTTEDQES